MYKLFRAILTGVFVLQTGAAFAITIDSSTVGITSPTTTIGFDEFSLANGAAVTNQFQSLGVTFSPQVTFLTSVSNRPNFSGGAAVNFGGSPFTFFNPLSINFTQSVNAASFAYTTNFGTTAFSALLNGSIVDTFSANTALGTAPNQRSNTFYGFTGINFNQIVISPAGQRTGAALDNLSYSVAAVPLPASLPLMLAGLFGLGALRARRRTISK